jgi:hypothetical protein
VKCGELDFWAFCNLSFGYKCRSCGTIKGITLENGEPGASIVRAPIVTVTSGISFMKICVHANIGSISLFT